MSFLQNSTTFAPYLNMKPHRTYILYISICLWLLASPLCIGNLWGKDFVVVIDAGHGGHDPGAIGKISKEKNINLNVALKLGNLIKKNCDDVKVIYTRSRDVFIPLDRRAEIANNAKADLFISVHTNALAKNRTAKGASTWTLGLAKSDANLEVAKRENSVILYESDYQTRYAGFNPNSAESYIIFEFMQDKYMEQSVHLASLVQKQFRHTCKRVDRGVHQAGFLVLKASAMPSILVELGFISTPEEERYLNSEAGANTMAKGIYHAFLNYKREQEIRLTGASKTIIPTEEPATSAPEQRELMAEASTTPATATKTAPTGRDTGNSPASGQNTAARDSSSSDSPMRPARGAAPQRQKNSRTGSAPAGGRSRWGGRPAAAGTAPGSAGSGPAAPPARSQPQTAPAPGSVRPAPGPGCFPGSSPAAAGA